MTGPLGISYLHWFGIAFALGWIGLWLYIAFHFITKFW